MTPPTNPVSTLLASIVAHAGEAKAPVWDRLALLAGDLLTKVSASVEGQSGWRSLVGYPGPAALTSPSRRQSIAGDVLERAQASMDSDNPDPRAAATGLAAARRLIAAGTRDDSNDRSLWMAYVLNGWNPRHKKGSPWYEGPGNGGPGPLAPDHLREGWDGDPNPAYKDWTRDGVTRDGRKVGR